MKGEGRGSGKKEKRQKGRKQASREAGDEMYRKSQRARASNDELMPKIDITNANTIFYSMQELL